MTEPQLKRLAEIVLNDNEKLEVIMGTLTNLIERNISKGDDFDGRANALLSSVEQLSALNEAMASEREKLRRDLGLL